MNSASEARAAEAKMAIILEDAEAQNDIFNKMLISPDPRSSQRSKTLGKEAKVVDLMDFGVDYALETYGDRPRVLTRILGALGSNYRELGMYKEAKESLTLALEYQIAADPTAYPDIVFKSNGLANLYRMTGDAEESARLYESALAYDALIENHPSPGERGVMLFNYAALLASIDQDQRAVEMYRQSLAIHLEHLPDRHAGISMLHSSLAVLEGRAGNSEAAEQGLRSALEFSKQIEPPNLQVLAIQQFTLGDFLSGVGDPDEASGYLVAALETARELYPDGSPRLIEFMLGYANHLMGLGRYEECEDAVYESMDLAAEHYEPGSLQLAAVLETYARWLTLALQIEEARGVLSEVQEIFKAKLPPGAPDHGRVGSVLERLQDM